MGSVRQMTDYFFYGTLCHAPLLKVVLGRAPVTQVATLPDYASHWAKDQIFPTLVSAPGQAAEGCLLPKVTAQEVARLAFYEAGYGFDAQQLLIKTAEGPRMASVYVPHRGLWQTGAPFNVDVWAARYGSVVTEAAHEVMAAMGTQTPQAVRARYPQILARAASRLRARDGAQITRRHRAAPGDVVVSDHRQPYAHFFAVEEDDLRFRRFDGTLSDEVTRAVFVSCDAATVLPNDPARDRVMLIEQFRMGPFARGDAQPWVIEMIAGRVDAFETPAECARREALEEAGLHLRDLLPIVGYYPSPGAKSEYLYAFIGLADLPESAAGLGGQDQEAEDIRAHVLAFDDLMRLIETGEVNTGPLIISALWLAANRDRLRTGG